MGTNGAHAWRCNDGDLDVICSWLEVKRCADLAKVHLEQRGLTRLLLWHGQQPTRGCAILLVFRKARRRSWLRGIPGGVQWKWVEDKAARFSRIEIEWRGRGGMLWLHDNTRRGIKNPGSTQSLSEQPTKRANTCPLGDRSGECDTYAAGNQGTHPVLMLSDTQATQDLAAAVQGPTATAITLTLAPSRTAPGSVPSATTTPALAAMNSSTETALHDYEALLLPFGRPPPWRLTGAAETAASAPHACARGATARQMLGGYSLAVALEPSRAAREAEPSDGNGLALLSSAGDERVLHAYGEGMGTLVLRTRQVRLVGPTRGSPRQTLHGPILRTLIFL